MHGPSFSTPAAAALGVTKPIPRSPVLVKPRPEDSSGLRILTYLRLHWLMILFCGSLLGGIGAYAAWELLAAKYESYALFQVSSVPTALANLNNPNQVRTDFVTYLKTTSTLLKSEFVLNAALRDLKDVPTIKAQDDPIKFLDEELQVTWQDGSEVIRVTFKSHHPADAKRIVDAVQKAFMSEVVQKDIQDKQRFLKQVEDARLELQKILRQQASNPVLTKGAATPGGLLPAGGVPKDIPLPMPGPPNPLPPLASDAPAAPVAPAAGPQPGGLDFLYRLDPRILVNKVAQLQSEVERLPLTINDGKRRLALLQQRMDAIKNAPVSQSTLDAVEKDQDVIVQILKVKQAKRDYDFRSRAADDPTVPAIQELKQVWEAQEAKLAQLRKEKEATIERDKRVAEAQRIASEMEELIRYLQRQQEQLDTAKASLARAEKQLLELPLPSDKGGLLPIDYKEPPGYHPEASDLDSTDGIYRTLVRQYYMTQMELNSPSRVRVLQPASTPTQRETKKQILGTALAGLMGFGLMILGVVGYETMVKRVSSLADIKAVSPMTVVGVIPHPPRPGRDPLQQAAAAESIDKLRTYVAQTWLARGATTLAMTSPLGDEGKAFTAFGLASSLAQCGYKTLLVDFDLRDPKLHELAGVPNSSGVCELLRGEIDPHSALVYLPSGLHLLPTGKWSDEARKAATGERLETLLAKLKGPYECVVVHTHALLAAADAVEVARRCEVVLVCACYRETTTPLLKRAADRVAAMEIPHSGVVYVGATPEEALC
jgi:Mrp family chromosome partitioning ATPase